MKFTYRMREMELYSRQDKKIKIQRRVLEASQALLMLQLSQCIFLFLEGRKKSILPWRQLNLLLIQSLLRFSQQNLKQ